MTPLPATARPDRRRARTRAALLQAGQSLFAARSVDGVSVDDIVLAADVAKGSFYNHFADKDALAREIAVAIRGQAEAAVTAANAGVVDAAERVVRGMTVFVRFGVEDPERARAMSRLHAGATLPEAPMNVGIRSDIAAGLASGRFTDVSLETGILLTMGTVQVAIAHALDRAGRTGPAEICSGLGFGLLRALGLSTEAARAVATAAAQSLFKETAP